MLTQENQCQSNGSDHDTRGTNQENHKLQASSCQCTKICKDEYNRYSVQKLVFCIVYSLVFATLALVTLVTQNYSLLPVISTMTLGLVSALHHVVGAPLRRLPVGLFDFEDKDGQDI